MINNTQHILVCVYVCCHILQFFFFACFEKLKLWLAFIKPFCQAIALLPGEAIWYRTWGISLMIQSSILFLTLSPVFRMAFEKPCSHFVLPALSWCLRLIILIVLFTALWHLQLTNALAIFCLIWKSSSLYVPAQLINNEGMFMSFSFYISKNGVMKKLENLVALMLCLITGESRQL